jgi:hypothetical protein
MSDESLGAPASPTGLSTPIPGAWWVIDRANNDAVIAGPFEYGSSAQQARAGYEHAASDAQNERWNLWVVFRKATRPEQQT